MNSSITYIHAGQQGYFSSTKSCPIIIFFTSKVTFAEYLCSLTWATFVGTYNNTDNSASLAAQVRVTAINSFTDEMKPEMRSTMHAAERQHWSTVRSHRIWLRKSKQATR